MVTSRSCKIDLAINPHKQIVRVVLLVAKGAINCVVCSWRFGTAVEFARLCVTLGVIAQLLYDVGRVGQALCAIKAGVWVGCGFGLSFFVRNRVVANWVGP